MKLENVLMDIGSFNYQYQYKDNDHNGGNDYKQDRNELAENLKSIGDKDGYKDVHLGSYNSDADTDLSNTEYSWYKHKATKKDIIVSKCKF
jgi:hypothetical protein